jgi:hypothetical protein
VPLLRECSTALRDPLLPHTSTKYPASSGMFQGGNSKEREEMQRVDKRGRKSMDGVARIVLTTSGLVPSAS